MNLFEKCWAWLKKLPWQRIGLISLCSVLSIVLTVMVVGTVFVEQALAQLRRPVDDIPGGSQQIGIPTETRPSGYTGPIIDPTQVILPTEPDPENILQHKDLINIMLVGQDRRPGENYRTRSDAMILCSFNTQNNSVTMTSFMRDLYVQIPGVGGNKMNHAYAVGGMDLIKQTMLLNFGVKVDAVVEVDFSSFQKVVDRLGGVGITLSAEEAAYINENYGDPKVEGNWPLKAGYNHLSGNQALYYSRIRAVGRDDFERTERQRKVLSAMISGMKNISMDNAVALMWELLPMLRTDMSNQQIFDYVPTLFPMLNGEIKNQRIPLDGTYKFGSVGNIYDVVLPDFEANRLYLMETLMPKN